MEWKSFQLGEFKALGSDSEPGSFEAVVGVFGNVDAGGDRIQKGAFSRSLGEWAEKGRSIPVLWSHDKETPPIGVVSEARETTEGLRVKARLFVGDHPQASAVYAAMKAGALQEFSFGYGARDYSHVVENGQKIRILKDIHLGEVSPVFAGMNPDTRLLAVKSANDDLQAQKDAIDRQIAELTEQSKTLGEAIASLNVLPEEPPPTTQETPQEGAEHVDKPDPNPTALDVGEEDWARINRLLAERPIHIQENES